MAKVKDEFRHEDLLLSISIDDDGWEVILDNDENEVWASGILDEPEAIAVFQAISDVIPRIYGGQL